MELAYDTVLIADLYKAIESDSPEILGDGITREQFEDFVNRYIDKQKGEPSVREKRLFALRGKIEIATACLGYLEQDPLDKDIIAVLAQHGFKITMENYADDLERVINQLTQLINKKKYYESEQEQQEKAGAKYNIYEILATMSAGLEGIYLNPKTLTISEFLAYQRVLEDKAKRHKEHISKANNRKNGVRR